MISSSVALRIVNVSDKVVEKIKTHVLYLVQGGSNMTGTDLCVNKPHGAATVRP